MYARINADGSPVVKRHRRLYKQDWELLYVPEGVMHMGFSVDHPLDTEPLVLGTPMPQEYGLAAHERITFSLLDLSALPQGVMLRLYLDDALISSLQMTNKAGGRYISIYRSIDLPICLSVYLLIYLSDR